MDDKIKVNIPLETYNILLKDMELFQFHKNNGSINKNAFYTELIVNYYEDFYEKEERIKNILIKQLRSTKDIDLSKVTSDIMNTFSSYQLGNITERNSKSIAIKPNRKSSSIISYINDYLLGNDSISGFYRKMFISYTKLPQDKRELIVFKRQVKLINQAISQKLKLSIFTKNSKSKKEISPYNLVSSKEELFNYLLASFENQLITFRLSKIIDVMILKENTSFTPSQIRVLKRMERISPQFTMSEKDQEEIVVKLNDSGKEMFKKMYVNRPVPIKIEGDLYFFDCSYTQIYLYFVRFGRFAYVIKPNKVRNQIKEFYRLGYHKYDKKEGRTGWKIKQEE